MQTSYILVESHPYIYTSSLLEELLSSNQKAVAVPATFVGEIHVTHCEAGDGRHAGLSHLHMTGAPLNRQGEEALNTLIIDGVDEIVCAGTQIHVVAMRLPGHRLQTHRELELLGERAAFAIVQWALSNADRRVDFTTPADVDAEMAVNSGWSQVGSRCD